jgi:alpha-L-fucosidase
MSNSGKPAKKGKGSRLCKTINTGKLYLKFKCVCPEFQPNCFVGYNHGEPSGRLCLREMGKPGSLGDSEASKYNKEAESSYKGYLVAEFTYPILPEHEGGAMWFYSLPQHDNLCHSAEKIYDDYLGAVKYGNIFSLNVGPNYEGKLRDIDVKTFKEVGKMILKLGK